MTSEELLTELNYRWNDIINRKHELEQEIMKLDQYRESTVKEMYVIKAWCIAEGLTFDLESGEWVQKKEDGK
jgi:hypothetical protein